MIFSIPSKVIKELKTTVTAVNLLDNSDFTNPVNDNGKTSYSGSKETITKWISRSGYCVVTVNSDSVNIKSSNGTTVAYVLQFLDAGKIKSGKSYTVACELKDGSIHCITGTASTSMTEVTRYIYVNEVQLGTIRFRYDTSEAKYAVMFSTLSTSGLDIVNVALYEGEYVSDNLPKYKGRSYSVEAAACNALGVPMDLLWTNASPTSGFAAQTLSLDLSVYRYAIIYVRSTSSSVLYGFSNVLKKDGNENILVCGVGSGAYRRVCKINNDNIEFLIGVNASDQGNITYCVPLEIYGIK